MFLFSIQLSNKAVDFLAVEFAVLDCNFFKKFDDEALLSFDEIVLL